MFDRLKEMEEQYEKLGSDLAQPEIVSDQARYQKAAKQHRSLESTVEKYREWKRVSDGIQDAKAMLAESDPDLRAMAQDELATLEPQLAPLEEELKIMLLPKDPNDEKNVVLDRKRV